MNLGARQSGTQLAVGRYRLLGNGGFVEVFFVHAKPWGCVRTGKGVFGLGMNGGMGGSLPCQVRWSERAGTLGDGSDGHLGSLDCGLVGAGGMDVLAEESVIHPPIWRSVATGYRSCILIGRGC